LTGSAGSISILKKIQNGVVLVKKKSTDCNRALPGQPGHGLCYFFITPAQFQPRISRVPGRPARPGQVSKHWEKQLINYSNMLNSTFGGRRREDGAIHAAKVFFLTTVT